MFIYAFDKDGRCSFRTDYHFDTKDYPDYTFVTSDQDLTTTNLTVDESGALVHVTPPLTTEQLEAIRSSKLDSLAGQIQTLKTIVELSDPSRESELKSLQSVFKTLYSIPSEELTEAHLQ